MSSIEAVKHLRIPLQELRDASNEFSEQNLIGKGGFGNIYIGESEKHGKIAVKMLDPAQGQGDHEFHTEIAVLSVHKHENFASLIGYCDEDQKKIIVYKYECNGSLNRHLSNTDLTWIQRLQICLDVARGLKYLHEHRIIYRDVKSANILLDENWKAKICDFGLCREIGTANEQTSFLISNACGTPGYIDPDYMNTSYLTQRSDVYSFGVVLFEVLCGRPTIVSKHKDNRVYLINLIKTHWRRKTLDEIIFSDLQKQIKPASLVTFTNIAYQCLKSVNERPTMKKVVQQLHKALNNQLTPSYSDDSGFAPHLQEQSELSASYPQSTHVSRSWEYDVFISFRGEDTRRTFVSHLYSALEYRRINTFRDDLTLSRGQSLIPSFIKIIQKSRIAIILFSQNYAGSSWCLDELAFIMKNRDEQGQIVMPIFYDVDPSEVRKQTGIYGEALDRHELKYSNNKVQSWREALKRVTDLAGWECSNWHEADLIRQFCDDISHKLGYYLPSYEASGETSANTHLIGMETRMQELKSLLEVGSLQIPLQELSDASNGFSDQNLIAKGGFGNVYKGESVKHGKIAIKMLDPGLGLGDHEFRTKIAVLSVYKHENLASLIGFCDEDQKKILVYKYECNGSLDKHLSNTDLTWIQRLQICLGAACGLQYLHDEHRIIHGDVKSANILLDENWKAKISGFEFCGEIGPANEQTSFLITNVRGTREYTDPEYYTTGYLTQRSDVYSFGVVMFEVLCGRPAFVRKYNDNRNYLTNLIKTHWRSNTLDEIIFSDLQKQIKPASFLTFTNIAYQCLKSGNERPTMKKVVEQLQKPLNNQLTSSVSDDSGFATHLQGQSGLLASSPQSTHVSSSQSWEYDVFISSRVADTRNTFTDHLYSALVNRGIFTYRDDDTISEEGSITSSLIKSIQKSRIAIILFSKNYAASSCCLDELAFIMKNRDERGQIVIPIFYDVEPSEVREHTGHYGTALDRLKLRYEYDDNKVQSWREALTWAGGIPGWECSNWHEVDLIRPICDDISHKLGNYLPSFEASGETSANTHLIGMETRMQELKSLLEVGSGDVCMVEIYGMWGSGKSTLASSVYDEISPEFEGCCFIKNVRDRSRKHGLKTLQEEILSNVLKSRVNFTDLEQGTYMMETGLREISVLIVLDDVHHTDHLKMLAGSPDWFGKGSRIIFTTENQHLLNDHNVPTNNVRMLDDTEAIEVFRWHAFGKREPVQDFEKDLLSLVPKCGGHPSVLKSVGSFLHGKDRSVWMRILNRLESYPFDEILKMFKDRNFFDWLLD